MGERIFVSVASSQLDVADRLVGYLTEAGHEFWYMRDSIAAGEFWPDEIVRGIEWCTHLVLIFDRDADRSPHVMRELDLADGKSKPILWLRITTDSPRGLEYFLRLPQAIPWPDTDHPPAELITVLAGERRLHVAQEPSGGEPLLIDPDATETVTLFVNRLPERDALRVSLERLLRTMATTGTERAVNENLLTFYGVGGQGKSRLSRRLQRWISGVLPSDDPWGVPPRTAHAVRWNLDGDQPHLIEF